MEKALTVIFSFVFFFAGLDFAQIMLESQMEKIHDLPINP